MKLLLIVLILFLLYLYLIMPRMVHRPDMTPMQTKFYAHRGLYNNHSDAPENSLRAFQKAVDAGFGIEFDLHLSKDGVPVVFHDFHLKRVTGHAGDVEDYTLEELKQIHLEGTDQVIPTLEEVLKLVDGKVPLLIEYKSESLDIRVCAESEKILRNYKGVYCIESFNPLAVRWYKKHRPDIVRGQLSDRMLSYPEFRKAKLFFGAFLLQGCFFNFLTRPDFIAFDVRFPNLSRFLDRNLFHSVSAAWTVKNNEQLKKAKHSYDVFIFDSFVPDSRAS